MEIGTVNRYPRVGKENHFRVQYQKMLLKRKKFVILFISRVSQNNNNIRLVILFLGVEKKLKQEKYCKIE